jgi:hypothetical protein
MEEPVGGNMLYAGKFSRCRKLGCGGGGGSAAPIFAASREKGGGAVLSQVEILPAGGAEVAVVPELCIARALAAPEL